MCLLRPAGWSCPHRWGRDQWHFWSSHTVLTSCGTNAACCFKLATAPLLGWLWSEVEISLLASCPGFLNKAVVPLDGFMVSQQLLKYASSSNTCWSVLFKVLINIYMWHTSRPSDREMWNSCASLSIAIFLFLENMSKWLSQTVGLGFLFSIVITNKTCSQTKKKSMSLL